MMLLQLYYCTEHNSNFQPSIEFQDSNTMESCGGTIDQDELLDR